MTRLLLLAAAAALLQAAPASAHEVLHAVEHGRAVAVHAYFPDGEDLAYCEYQVFSPADPRVPYQKGRTDRRGWLAFVPDAPGGWRIRVVEASGHGLDTVVDVTKQPDAARSLGSAAFVLRPAAGVAAVAALFAALIAYHRRAQRTP